MKFEFNACFFRITLEFFWPAQELIYRRYRIAHEDAHVRRKLMRGVYRRLNQ